MINLQNYKGKIESELKQATGCNVVVNIFVIEPPKEVVTIPQIISIVGEGTGYSPEKLTGNDRRRGIVDARHIAMTLATEYTRKTLVEIAGAFGKTDHSTVIHAREKIYWFLKVRDDTVTHWYNECKKLIKQYYE